VIAIVDDDALIRDALKDLLDSAGYSSVAFSSAQGFLKSKRLASFACLVTDMRMPRTTGIELYDKLVNAGHAIPTILITAYPDETVRARAIKAGILCYLPKRVASDALLACVDEQSQAALTRALAAGAAAVFAKPCQWDGVVTYLEQLSLASAP
jgi:FixJ family two-component response regulator